MLPPCSSTTHVLRPLLATIALLTALHSSNAKADVYVKNVWGNVSFVDFGATEPNESILGWRILTSDSDEGLLSTDIFRESDFQYSFATNAPFSFDFAPDDGFDYGFGYGETLLINQVGGSAANTQAANNYDVFLDNGNNAYAVALLDQFG